MEKHSQGMFAKALMELWPELPIEDEGRLADVSLRHSFYIVWKLIVDGVALLNNA